jgi:23S rRNA pseudouridine1911/1915/1917 synthase
MAYFGGKHTFRSINRLDRDTSGIVLMAKDAYSAAALSASMKRGEFHKKYIAKVAGVLENKNGVIDAPIRRIAEGEMKRIVAPDGKRAVTEYKVIKESDGESLVEVILHTGRTHQIRVHLSHIGHVIAGDELYGGRTGLIPRQALHAYHIEFTHPATGEYMMFETDYPEDIKAAISKLNS